MRYIHVAAAQSDVFYRLNEDVCFWGDCSEVVQMQL